MKNIITFNLGESVRFSRPVNQILIERLPLTIELAMASLFIAVAVGVPMGIVAARRHNTFVDGGTMAVANIGVSMPVFWLGLMLSYLFAIVLKGTFLQLPPSGRLTAGLTNTPYYEVWGWQLTEGTFWAHANEFLGNFVIGNSFITGDWVVFWDATRHMILPAIALATIPLAVIARITRSSLLEVMGRDYIRTARAKGAKEGSVVRAHALRNALLPVVTIIGLQLGALLGGAVLTETVFNLAGAQSLQNAEEQIERQGERSDRDKRRHRTAHQHAIVDLQHEEGPGQHQHVDHQADAADAPQRAAQ
jgi:ABC-type dipeptide/oligopeptide/nickel transport system permease component